MVKAGSARMRFATESSGVVLWLVGAESTVKPFTYFGRVLVVVVVALTLILLMLLMLCVYRAPY